MLTIDSVIEEMTGNLKGYDAFLVGKILENICGYAVDGHRTWLTDSRDAIERLIEYYDDREDAIITDRKPKVVNSATKVMKEFNPEEM